MKKIMSYVLVMVVLALCMPLIVMPVNATSYPFNITDSAGREVTIQMPITRIIVLNTDTAEAVKVLGAIDKVVGIAEGIKTKKSYYFPDPDLVNATSVGKWDNPDFEKIIKVATNATTGVIDPDIIVIQYAYTGATVKYGVDYLANGLKDYPNITVVGLDFYKQDTMCEEIEKLGKILDRENKAKDFIDWRKGKEQAVADGIAEIKLKMKGELPNAILSYLRATYLGEAVEHLELNELRRYAWSYAYGPKVFIETRYKGPGEISTRGPGSGDHATCTMAGGYNIASDLDMAYPKVTWEWVLAENPDVIIRGVYTTGWGWSSTEEEPKSIVDGIKSREAAESIFAVKDNRVYAFCNEPLYGLDNVAGLTYWAKIFYPELNLNPKAVYTEYLTTFMSISYPEDRVFVYPGV
ncbi:MAG: ABC transporter substrate-binding protein [Methanophagales archaeon ANME-1-THS]|nr:MAG: ABC transporter substrate-binding protein [Methanophagales archaeon ANME-1-THS]